MNYLKKIISETGDASCMRLMSIMSLTVASLIAFISIYKNCSLSQAAPTISIFVTSAFGGKIWQKYVEADKNKRVEDLKNDD